MTDELTTLTEDERIRRSRYWAYQMLSCQRLYGVGADDKSYNEQVKDRILATLQALFREYPDEIENVVEDLWRIRAGAIMAHLTGDTTKIEVRR